MALTTTVAGTSSDSYASVAEADSYLSWKDVDAWEAASDATKEGVLKAAVAVLDNLPYAHPRSDRTQALRFPTTRMTDTSGDYYIPERVKRAQAYLAAHMLDDPDLFAGDGNVKQVSVPGGFSVTMGGSGQPILPPDVYDLIERYLFKGGPGVRFYSSAHRGYI